MGRNQCIFPSYLTHIYCGCSNRDIKSKPLDCYKTYTQYRKFIHLMQFNGSDTLTVTVLTTPDPFPENGVLVVTILNRVRGQEWEYRHGSSLRCILQCLRQRRWRTTTVQTSKSRNPSLQSVKTVFSSSYSFVPPCTAPNWGSDFWKIHFQARTGTFGFCPKCFCPGLGSCSFFPHGIRYLFFPFA